MTFLSLSAGSDTITCPAGVCLTAVCMAAVFLAAALIAGIRLCILKKALQETGEELRGIREDLSRNQAVRLPAPDRDLEKMLEEINHCLRDIQEERNRYARREKMFQSQIEAVSHDLRTPLTVILGYLRIMKKQELNREILDIIIRRAESMEKLTEQLYEYARLGAGDYEPECTVIDAGKILRETFADHCIALENAGLRADVCFVSHPVLVQGNQEALERIFANLIQNAARYAYSRVSISVRETECEGADDSRLEIIFENDTEKITAGDVPCLFERFYMSDSSRSGGGTGLGLTVARMLARKMGGDLRAEYSGEERGQVSRPVIRFILEMKRFF